MDDGMSLQYRYGRGVHVEVGGLFVWERSTQTLRRGTAWHGLIDRHRIESFRMSHFMDITDITVGTLVRGKKSLVEVKSSTSIYDTLRIMDEHNIISCPLYEAPQSNTPVSLVACGREFVAFVSISDILAFVLRQSTMENVQDALDSRILDVVGVSNESMIHSVETESEPLRVVMEKMTKGVHRCLIFPADHHRLAPKVLTQTDVVQFLVDNCAPSVPDLEEAMDRNVQEVMTGSHLLTAQADTPLPLAMEMLQVHPAVAVVNQKQQVVSTLSASDFRSVYKELEAAGTRRAALLKSLSDMSVRQFLTRNSPDDIFPVPAVCVSKDASLFAAAEYMVQHHIHRVWIVNDGNVDHEEGVGVGCLSFTDIIKSVLHTIRVCDDELAKL